MIAIVEKSKVDNWTIDNSQEKNNCSCVAGLEAADHEERERVGVTVKLLTFFQLEKVHDVHSGVLLEAFLCSRCQAAYSQKSLRDVHSGKGPADWRKFSVQWDSAGRRVQ